jgi:hypothetical protein
MASKWIMIDFMKYDDGSWETYYSDGVPADHGGKMVVVRTYHYSVQNKPEIKKNMDTEMPEVGFVTCLIYHEETILWKPLFSTEYTEAEKNHSKYTKAVESGRLGYRDTEQTIKVGNKVAKRIATEWYDAKEQQ